MSWKSKIKQNIPPVILNNVLLLLPFLYHTRLVNYETNIPEKGIDDLLSQLELVLQLDGNIIECGISRGGASILMARKLIANNIHKQIYACDSFQGFDQEELKKEKTEGLTTVSEKAFTSTSYEYVKKKLVTLGLNELVIPVPGFFQDTLPHIDSEYCFVLIDCDFKDSIVYCAETIWPHLSSGGRILFDDYTSDDFKSARTGVDYFVSKFKHEIEEHGLLNHLYLVKKK